MTIYTFDVPGDSPPPYLKAHFKLGWSNRGSAESARGLGITRRAAARAVRRGNVAELCCEI